MDRSGHGSLLRKPDHFDDGLIARRFAPRWRAPGVRYAGGCDACARWELPLTSTPPYRLHLGLLAIVAVVLAWSAIRPYDWYTWVLEVAPAVIGIPLLIWLYPRFRFTNLVYILVAIHASLLIIGGHYTYARVPLFEWLKDALHLQRNYYDRVGHFAQGFVPALIAREVLLRKTRLERDGWLRLIVVSICLAISAAYELLEWAAAEFSGSAADEFLGTQGDVWDTQKDMALALIGAICALGLLSRLQDRQMRQHAAADDAQSEREAQVRQRLSAKPQV